MMGGAVARAGPQSPLVVQLQASERKLLKRLVGTPTAQYRQVLRAKIVLAAAAGLANAQIARRLGITVNTVRKWRKRYAAQGLAGLADRKRCGRPRVYPAVVVAQAKAIACELPATRGVPLSRWSLGEVRAELLASGITPNVSVSTVGRWLHADAIKPWRYRSWIFPRDPDFAAKAAQVLDLYARVCGGVPLGPDDYVISADEKSQLQALRRCHPSRPAGPGHLAQV